MMLLDVKDLTVSYGELTITDKVSFQLEEGQWLMLIGPNGAGKTTVVRAISQAAPYTGEVWYCGKNIKAYKPSQLAQHIGVLSQKNNVGYSFTVGEVVRMGRYAHSRHIFAPKAEEEQRIVQEAMEMTGVAPLADQSVLTLSGGELQRTFLAQLFAQNPRVLILDEPTNHLDLVYQKQVFELIRTWLQQPGRAVISVVHDLSLARAYGTHALLLDRARTLEYGTVEQVFASERLNTAYNMNVRNWMRDMLGQWE